MQAEETTETTETTQRLKLGDLKRTGQRTGFTAPILTGFNMGNRTISLVIPMEKFKEISAIANEARIIPGDDHNGIAQRPLDEPHAKKIAIYMLRGLLASVKVKYLSDNQDIPQELDDVLADLGEGPYQGLQPFTGNIRNCAFGGDDLDLEKRGGSYILNLLQGQIIMVVDGQHRRFAYSLLTDWLNDILNKGRYMSTRKGGLYLPEGREEALELSQEELTIWGSVYEEAKAHCTVDVTVHLGLQIHQERQLFHDLNNLGKKVEPSIAQAFDQANPINIFIRRIIEGEPKLLGDVKIVNEGSKKGGKRRDAVLTTDGSIIRDDLVIANSLLFAGMTNPAGIPNSKVDSSLGERFWRAVSSQPYFGQAGWQEKTLLAQPTMIKALAQLAYNFSGSREANDENLETLLGALEQGKIDFSATNHLWRTYLVDDYEAQFPGISEYITPVSSRSSYAILDPANNILRFTSNTRDVARYLGDLIRWQLQLPVRPGLAKLKGKLDLAAATVKP